MSSVRCGSSCWCGEWAETLLPLFLAIGTSVHPTSRSYLSVQWSNPLYEASETMSVVPKEIGMVQGRPANELTGRNPLRVNAGRGLVKQNAQRYP